LGANGGNELSNGAVLANLFCRPAGALSVSASVPQTAGNGRYSSGWAAGSCVNQKLGRFAELFSFYATFNIHNLFIAFFARMRYNAFST
jgi:hypothetical protein